ncbi:MAG: hypothetical protein KKC46_04745 [Proteobacteria bacterium]|nr:hypothetical protein [Pseudomonadota bacterium]
MLTFAKIISAVSMLWFLASVVVVIFSSTVQAANTYDLYFYVYGMPGATPIQCAITPDINNANSWVPKISTYVDTSPSGETLLPIGKYSEGMPVTCAITEDSAFISGYKQSLFVTWPGHGCLVKNQGSWSQIAIIAKGPGCP